ncbi:MAG: bifunctional DNA-formamidopyrimidine glycosylase/DNA-(apurinic or apyrimidinic site) lyase [Candidatus Veblenbacteria bacterium]|nr:bifunctional DNA-formamidopyrimidine glycosylase/DNA-(apurinic or apyrimidinic site) lyase [Candidatus Veblenbacteria bacterium]MDZ4230161.1 bifunctional DNA-formamidopyrimidine glycosylase/DNA-(apurinic or apyrimidinic site) lyase [Candidatus Veblenbacteria bacterium]
MPELPEVETIRRDLTKHVVGKLVQRVEVRKAKLIQGSRAVFRRALIGARITRVSRRAKQLILELSSGYVALVHLKMTGQLVWRSRGGMLTVGGHPIISVNTVPNKFTYVTLRFSDGSALFFNDVRQFGYWRAVPLAELAVVHAHLGPEPLSSAFTPQVFWAALQRRGRTTIKAALLDQSVVAGIGNIYADESLYVARLRPSRRVASLRTVETAALFRAICSVLRKAVAARGTSFNSYVDGLGRQGTYWERRLVYGRTGEACRRCGTLFKRTVVAGRGSHWCAHCQH